MVGRGNYQKVAIVVMDSAYRPFLVFDGVKNIPGMM